MITIYGIHNCDTIKRAKQELEGADIGFNYHDFRKDGLSEDLLIEMLQVLGVEKLVNKRGTTWRQLSQQEQEAIESGEGLSLLLENVALIKRPVWQKGREFRIGFAKKETQELLNWATA